ncbi:MAG TPA: hypothetical protein VKE74_26430 [Gemmataceae bacterium]|nr:hypothetical protein [Gemmataceae bacterium]
MPATIRCTHCPVTLRVPEGAAGKSVRCPKCQAVIPVPGVPAPAPPPEPVAERPPLPAPAPRRVKPEFVDDEPATPLSLDDGPPPDRPPAGSDDPAAPAPKKRKKKAKKKKGLFGWLPDIVLEDSVKRLAIGCLVLVVGIVGLVVGGYYAFRTPPPPEIPASEWVEVEVPNVFRAKLPGTAERKVQQAPGGITMVTHDCQPNKNCIYAIAYTEGPLPPHMQAMTIEELLNDSCDGAVAGVKDQGGKELKREPVTLGPHPGKQLIIGAPRGQGKMISRIFVAHGRKFMVMAGGRGYEADQKNVQRLFESFEILDPGPAPKPAPKPTPTPQPGPGPAPTPKSEEPPAWAEDLDIPFPQVGGLIAGLGYGSDGKTLVVGTADATALWYDTAARKVVATRRRTNPGEGMNGCAVSPDANRVAFYRHGGLVFLLDRREPGETVLNPDGGARLTVWKAAFSPDGKRLCTTHGDRLARVWDVGERKLVKELTGHTEQITSAAFSPDGKLLATGDPTLRLWDPATFAHLASLKTPGQRTFSEIAFDPSSQRLAAAAGPTVCVWDLGTDPDGGLTISDPRLEHHANMVRAVRFAPDGRLVTLTDGGVLRVMDGETGKTLTERAIGGPGGYVTAAMHPTEARLAIVVGNRIRVIDLDKFAAE